ncbi:class I SAM-dependent methyltransferase [Pseudaestuariivita rosea]|uniref:class I SAM-dependent methyltransferase n=1 Tax=Pseudaestuariivita rosea TaxID=2763263 RepID=UPI001ABAC15B|nr:class I SAM-dependent methyltransferase [Pseudaestuariivita rosea]
MASLSRRLIDPLKYVIGGVLQYAPERVQVHYKRLVELLFWKKTLRGAGGDFYNKHLEIAFTRVFDLTTEFYAGKRIVDIGCGPVGTLEWADIAAERVGVDPLAEEYLKLNRGQQAMTYVEATAEDIPFDDGYFDVVSLFNSLDHVENVDAAIAEAVRLAKSGGIILLIVEVDHKPTITEPNMIDESILEAFEGCDVLFKAIYRIRDDHDVYASVFEANSRTDATEPGVMCVKLQKQ